MYNTTPIDYTEYLDTCNFEQIRIEIEAWKNGGRPGGYKRGFDLSSRSRKLRPENRGGSSPIRLSPNWKQQYETERYQLAMNI